MPLYHFDVDGGSVRHKGPGQEFADNDAAWREAALVAGEMFKDVADRLEPGQSWSLVLSDEHHKPLYSFKMTTSHLQSGRS